MGFNEPPTNKIVIHGARRKEQKMDWSLFKSPTIPDGFVLLIDTREQTPMFTGWQMEKDEIRTDGNLIMKGKTLRVGDYSLGGYEKQVTIERKMQSDFESFIQGEYKRKTIGKLERMSKMFFAGIVIEASMVDLCEYPLSPKMTREKVINHLTSFKVHYGIHVMIGTDRKALELCVLHELVRAYNYLHSGILFAEGELK